MFKIKEKIKGLEDRINTLEELLFKVYNDVKKINSCSCKCCNINKGDK